LRRQVDDSLRRLQTDFIDLYYLHRVDRKVPVEESLGALGDAVQQGKIGAVGLSEVSGKTLERALAVSPIAAVQNEYSIWTRNCELGVSNFCAEHDIALVAFSPICRGFVAMAGKKPGEFEDGDIRRGMPRFRPENFEANQVWLSRFQQLAASADMSPAQLALAWLIAKGEHVAPIPGTTSEKHLADNFFVCQARVPAELEQDIDRLMAPALISGNRYPEGTQTEIDTERFPFELDRS
jgi:aryl-alcohol dehydrogenase-like predicted oxidoreductase